MNGLAVGMAIQLIIDGKEAVGRPQSVSSVQPSWWLGVTFVVVKMKTAENCMHWQMNERERGIGNFMLCM